MSENTPIVFTLFTDLYDKYGTSYEQTWSDFVEFLETHAKETVREVKDMVPLISGYVEGGKKLENWQGTNWIGLDVDETCTEEELLTKVTELDFTCFVHTTWKHTSESPRLRLIIPFEGWIDTTDDYDLAWLGLQTLFMLGDRSLCDRACKNINRGFYVPCVRPESWTYSHAGQMLTQGDLMALGNAATPEKPKGPSDELKGMRAALLNNGASIVPKKRTKPVRHVSIQDSDIVKNAYVTEYWNTPQGQHHIALYTCLCKIAGRAAALGYPLQLTELEDMALQIDRMDAGGPYYDMKKIKTEARAAYEFAFKP